LKEEEAGEGSGELAVVGDFVAHEEFGRNGIGGAAEGKEDLDGRGADIGVDQRQFAINSGFLCAPDAEKTPAGDGHGFDQAELGGGGGLEFVDEGAEEIDKAVLDFGFEDDGGGEEAVAEAVAGGSDFAFGRNGASGLCAVAAGGLDLFFRSHEWGSFPGESPVE